MASFFPLLIHFHPSPVHNSNLSSSSRPFSSSSLSPRRNTSACPKFPRIIRTVFPDSSPSKVDGERFSLPSARLLRSQKDAISLFFLSPFPFLSLFPYPRLIGKLAGFNRCKQRNKRIKRRKEKKKYSGHFRMTKSSRFLASNHSFILGYFGWIVADLNWHVV